MNSEYNLSDVHSCDAWTVEQSIDLDAAAVVATSVLNAGKIPGLHVYPFTWLDGEAEWPRRLEADRQLVKDPISLGIRAQKGEREGTLVIFGGGWADLSYVDLSTGYSLEENPGWGAPLQIDGYRELVNRFLTLFQ